MGYGTLLFTLAAPIFPTLPQCEAQVKDHLPKEAFRDFPRQSWALPQHDHLRVTLNTDTSCTGGSACLALPGVKGSWREGAVSLCVPPGLPWPAHSRCSAHL